MPSAVAASSKSPQYFLDLAALSLALCVSSQGSFRKAASALGVRPSVVSRRIRVLEDALGVSLFQRRSQGVEPTIAGRRILSQGLAILTDAEALLRTAALDGVGTEGQLRIGIVASIAGGKARELLVAFTAAYPQVELNVVEGLPQDHVAAIRALRMDVALVVGSPAASGCNLEPLWSEPIFVAVAANSALASLAALRWEQLASQVFVVSKMGPGPEIEDIVMRHLSELGRRPVIKPRPVQRGGLLGLVSLGIGVTLVGTAEATVTYPGVVFRPLVGEVLPFSAVWKAENDNPALRRFLNLARRQMGAGSLPARKTGA